MADGLADLDRAAEGVRRLDRGALGARRHAGPDREALHLRPALRRRGQLPVRVRPREADEEVQRGERRHHRQQPEQRRGEVACDRIDRLVGALRRRDILLVIEAAGLQEEQLVGAFGDHEWVVLLEAEDLRAGPRHPGARRRGVELDPSEVGEVDLGPRPRVLLGQHVRPRLLVVEVRADEEADGDAGRVTERAHHDRHGRGVVVEVALARLEEEVVHRVTARGLVVHLQAEAVVRAQVVLDLERRHVWRLRVARDVGGKLAHAVGQALRELEVALRHPRGVVRARADEDLRVGRRDRPHRHVAVARADALVGLQRREVDRGRTGHELRLDVGREGVADGQQAAVGERLDHLDLRDDGAA